MNHVSMHVFTYIYVVLYATCGMTVSLWSIVLILIDPIDIVGRDIEKSQNESNRNFMIYETLRKIKKWY